MRAEIRSLGSRIIVGAFLAGLLAACAGPVPDPTRVQALSSATTPANTPTAVPTATASPAPSPVPATPQPTIPPASYPVAHDGRTVLFARDDDLWRMRPDGGEEQRLSRGGAADWTGIGEIWEWANCCGPAVSPDGRWVVWTDGTSRSFLVDTAGPTQRVLLEQFAGFAWAPDSRTLAYLLPMERECAVHLYGLFDGNDECLIGQSEQWDIKRMVWSPDSRFIAYACYGQPVEPYTGTSRLEVRSVDVATRQVETVGEMEVHIASSTYLCWTADGQVVSGRAVPPGSVRCSPDLASRQTSPDGMRSLHTMDLQYARAPQTGWRVWVTANDAGEDAAPVWQREFPGPACTRVFWSVDGEYLLLDDREANSPIWRLRADGTGELERIVEDGFFIDVIAAWE